MTAQLLTFALVLYQLLLTPTSAFRAHQLNTLQQPEFGVAMENLTVAKGRDASFTCIVHNLGTHRVAWIKADDKGIIAMHDRVLTNNARLSVLHNDLQTWTLQIRDVRRSDRGMYMCQINTEPMRHQLAFLEVVIPPDILSEGGSEMLVPEGGSARLSCKVRGFPQPRVTWRREDGQDLVIRNNGAASPKLRESQYEGEVLVLHKITRSEMGAYLCIATNGVPPSVSRRVVLNVHFYPIIHVPNSVIGASSGSNATLECNVEASPKPINYWVRDTGEIIIPNGRYRTEEIDVNSYACRLRLHIHSVSSADDGIYKCASKNSIGDSEGHIRLQVVGKASIKPSTPSWTEVFYDERERPVEPSNDWGPRWSEANPETEKQQNAEFSPNKPFMGSIELEKSTSNCNLLDRISLLSLIIIFIVNLYM